MHQCRGIAPLRGTRNVLRRSQFVVHFLSRADRAPRLMQAEGPFSKGLRAGVREAAKRHRACVAIQCHDPIADPVEDTSSRKRRGNIPARDDGRGLDPQRGCSDGRAEFPHDQRPVPVEARHEGVGREYEYGQNSCDESQCQRDRDGGADRLSTGDDELWTGPCQLHVSRRGNRDALSDPARRDQAGWWHRPGPVPLHGVESRGRRGQSIRHAHQQQGRDLRDPGDSGWPHPLVCQLALYLRPMPHRRADRDPGEGGFTLIEGMIALVVLSIGLLAVSGMQAVALSRNVDANQLSQITHLTAEMVERVRFNRGNVMAYNGIDTAVVATRPPVTQPQAQGDYDQWGARLAQSGIAGIRGQVTVAALAPTALNQNQVTVRVNWIGGLLNRAVVVTTVVVPE